MKMENAHENLFPPSHEDGGFINEQRALCESEGSFGKKGSIAKNGCGSIAAYNALKILGANVNYKDVLARFNFHVLNRGRWGANPFYLYVYFKKRGFRIKVFLRRKFDRLKYESAAYIALYTYKSKSGFGAHYVAAQYNEKNGYTVYNEDYYGKTVHIESLKELISRNKAKHIAVMMITKK